jgi:hypothetical protein
MACTRSEQQRPPAVVAQFRAALADGSPAVVHNHYFPSVECLTRLDNRNPAVLILRALPNISGRRSLRRPPSRYRGWPGRAGNPYLRPSDRLWRKTPI